MKPTNPTTSIYSVNAGGAPGIGSREVTPDKIQTLAKMYQRKRPNYKNGIRLAKSGD